MKKIWKRAAAMLLAVSMVLALAACSSGGGNNSPAPSGSGGESPSGGDAAIKSEIVFARREDSNNLDPVLQDGNVNIWFFTMVLESLLKVSDDGTKIEPGLAETWDVSEDGMTYTFHLKEGLVFSNGDPVLAEDLVWSYERAMHTEESLWAELCLNLDSVEAPDDTTFIVHVKEASPVDEVTFTLFNLTIGDKSYFEEVGEEAYAKCPVGTGAYKFGEWKQGEYLMLEKNENYRDADSVKTEKIRVTVVPDDNTRVMQLQGGNADLISDVPWNRMSEVEATSGLDIATPISTEVRSLNFNCTKGPTADVKVRQALTMAIDKEAIVKMVLFGYGEVADSYLPPSIPYYISPSTTKSHDVEAAKALLAEAGYADGFDITLTTNAGNAIYEQMATMIKEQLAAIGVNVTIELLEAGTFNAKRAALELDMFFGGWTSDIPDPSQQTSYWCLPATANSVHTGWSNDRVIELGYAAAKEMDSEKRAEMYAEIQEIYADECPTVPIYYAPYGVGMSAKLDGFSQIPTGPYRFNNLTCAE